MPDPIARPYVIQAYTRTDSSIGFMGILVVSELLQDALVQVLLLQEWIFSKERRVLSADARRFLDSTLHPPIFSSTQALEAFLLPLLASTAFTGSFVWAVARLPYSNRAEALKCGRW